jgi:hypothetical protein
MWRGTTCKLRPPLRKYWAALPRVMTFAGLGLRPVLAVSPITDAIACVR